MYLTMSVFVLFIIVLDLLLGVANKRPAPRVYDSQTARNCKSI